LEAACSCNLLPHVYAAKYIEKKSGLPVADWPIIASIYHRVV